MNQIHKILLFVPVFLMLCTTEATAKQALLYYILDGSGSMRRQAGGEVKIDEKTPRPPCFPTTV